MNTESVVIRLSYVPLFGKFKGMEKSMHFITIGDALDFIQRMNQSAYDNYELSITWRTPESE